MNIYLDFNKEYQTFEGIGASGAWWAQEVGGWDHIDTESGLAVRDRISQLLYSKSQGIGMRTYRYNLGGGSKESGKGQFGNKLRRAECFEASAGEYDFSKDKNAVYMLKRAVKDGADEVVFFVNSPIERLTINGLAHCSKGTTVKENLDEKNYGAFAKYVLDVTEHFVSEGIPIKYISPINEPYWKWTGNQEGCHYKPKSAGRVMSVFASEIAKRPALNGVLLSGLENGDIRWRNKSYTKALLDDEVTKYRVDGIDLHSYFLHPINIPFFRRVDYLKRYRKWLDRYYPNTNVKMSEWTHMKEGRDKTINSALEMARIMYEDISILNVTAWQHWIAVSEVDYCDGLIYINLEDKSFEMTKRYYATGNFSKYISYGATRVEISCDDKDLKLLAFKKDSKIIVIVVNDTESEKTISLPNYSKGIIAVTNEQENLIEHEIDLSSVSISAKSINTIIFNEEIKNEKD